MESRIFWLRIFWFTDFLIFRFTEKFFEVVFTDLLHGNWMKTVIYSAFKFREN